VDGPAWLTGGAFGLEASAIAVAAWVGVGALTPAFAARRGADHRTGGEQSVSTVLSRGGIGAESTPPRSKLLASAAGQARGAPTAVHVKPGLADQADADFGPSGCDRSLSSSSLADAGTERRDGRAG
jgi:hypothetical protein